MGNKTQTATSQQTSTPVNTAALQSIYGQVANAASTPYTPYGGELTAGINGQQTAGINTINAGANAAQPYYAQAGQLASGAANPLTASQIQQYQNPYTQNVVNATQAQFNDQNGQQQNSLKGTAAQQGALGGDRQAVAQAQLAGQQNLTQAPVIAGLYANSYNSGLQTAAQQYQQNPLAAASSLAGIGSGAQNAALAGGNAQLQAGALQQQTQQAADTANYGQYQAAQAFPYQQAQFAEQYGLPAALAQGTSSSGTQTTPGPSILGQIAGLGIAGAGVATKFAADGGAIEGYATGGAPGYINSKLGYIDSGQGYIPSASGAAGPTALNAPSLKFGSQPQQSANPLTSAISGLPSFKNPLAYGASVPGADGPTSIGGAPLNMTDAQQDAAQDAADGYKIGGLVEAIHHIHRTIKGYRNGGMSHFADGGDASFAGRFQPAVDSPFGDMPRGQAIALLGQSRDATIAPSSIGGNDPPVAQDQGDVVNPDTPYRLDPTADQSWRAGVDQPNPAVVADASRSNPMANSGLPPQITNPDNVPDAQPSPALAYDSTGQLPTPLNAPPTDQQSASSLNPFHLSDKGSNALIATGLGMLASRSPFAGVALGEGGLRGLQNYSEETKAEQEAADKKLTHDMEAKRILNQVEQYNRSQKETERYHKSTEASKGEMTDYQKAQIEHQTKTEDPEYIKAVANAKRTPGISEEALGSMADSYMVGNTNVISQIARGTSGSDNLNRFWNVIEGKLKDQGLTGKDLAAAKANFTSQSAAATTAARRAANVEASVEEARKTFPLALEASAGVPRTDFVPWNQLVQKFQTGTSNVAQAKLFTATQGVITAYSQAMARTGVSTVDGRHAAEALLSTATSPEAYQAVISQMEKEMEAAASAPEAVRQQILGRISGKPPAEASSTGAPVAPPEGLKEGQTGTRADGTRVVVKNGQIVPAQ